MRNALKDKKRIVIKIGTSTITDVQTGNLKLRKLEKFVRLLVDLRNEGKEIIVVSSGAIGVGKNVLRLAEIPRDLPTRQACAAVGQGRLMMIYEKLFGEYGALTAQVLLTKESVSNEECANHARQTFSKLLSMDVVPIVNENDAISADESSYGNFGDNDTLSAYVTMLVNADLLILMSDIDGLYTDDPRKNPNAKFIKIVDIIDTELEQMGKDAGTAVGTGGMATKIKAAKMATHCGADMVIVNGEEMNNIVSVIEGEDIGTLFLAEAKILAGGA